jgi:biopolymer transport protein ExbD
MQSVSNNKTAPFINVTPLIDVLLVLLIIFMIISPTRPSKFDAKSPQKPTTQDADNRLALVVSINHGGGYELNTQPASTLDELKSKLIRERFSLRRRAH